jgi:serine/threonine-protein kinase
VGVVVAPAGEGDQVPAEPQPAEEVLRSLEAAAATGRAVFSTNVGMAEVHFKGGSVIAARLGQLAGRGALFRLLGAGNVRHEFLPESIDFDTPVAPSIDDLVASLRRWDELSRRAPALSSVLECAPIDSAVPTVDDPERALLLGLVDGERTLAEVLGASGLDPIHALSLAVDSVERDLIRVRTSATSLFPLAAADQPEVLPDLSAPPPLRSSHALAFSDELLDLSEGDVEPSPHARELDAAEPSSSRSGRIPAESGPVPTKIAAVPAPAAAPEKSGGNRTVFIGRYEVLCRIGQGGMGNVYLGRLSSEAGFRRLFALKLLRSRLLDTDGAAERFLDEARLAGHMHHPNVVSVVDSGMFGGRPYLVMDYVEGGSLRELLDRRFRALPQQVAISVVLDALAGLEATHTLVSDEGTALRVIHGDVSPENLLVGVDGICRLSDFGIARSAVEAARHRRTTRGRPAYLAPEQVLGRAADQRADIFAMGTVLFETLTGVPLFHAATAEGSLQQVCVRRIPLPSTIGSRPSPSLDWVCMKALERDPERRFATAKEMLTELRRAALRDGLLAPSPEVAARVRLVVGRQLARRRLFVLESLKGGSVPTGGVEASLDSGRGARAPRAAPSPAEQNPARPGTLPRAKTPRDEPSPSRLRSFGRSLLVLASVLALLAVVATSIWPEAAKDLFSRVTSHLGWRTLSDSAADE